MVILNFLQCSPDRQTTLEFPNYTLRSHSMITMTPFFAIMAKTKAKKSLYQILKLPDLSQQKINMLKNKTRSLRKPNKKERYVQTKT